MANFGRVVEVMVAGMTFSMDKFNIEGTVPFDDDTLPNESEIKIWNLTAETINKIKRGDTLMINAGYIGDVGVILHGFVSAVRSRREGVDKVTSIYVIDSEDLSKRTLKDVSYKEGTLASYIIKDMAGQIGLRIAQFELVRDYRYMDGYTASGEVTGIIAKVAEDCKTAVYINKGRLYIRNLKRGADNRFKLSADTGLIGVPEYQEDDETKGYQITSQLQYRITTASVVDLISQTFTGRLYVRSGAHTFSRTGDFTTAMETIL
ncbi:phage protein [Paenibacillus sp. MDMC362]|uniref:phage protein n=1 Tax=Paenibacillus sp. MDMC362 TaxID=2977365 RepID=UPI000DC30046|nr:hypothetical protein [Paenibacillus sp. MDMC362]RAR39670.1 hypothetical protein DP091_29740 [Paenibacillus sp. MDMC362]